MSNPRKQAQLQNYLPKAIICCAVIGVATALAVSWTVYLPLYLCCLSGTILAGIIITGHIDILSPFVSFPAIFLLYYGIGSVNVTTYRGIVSENIQYYILAGIIAYLAGICFCFFVFRLFSGKFRLILQGIPSRRVTVPTSDRWSLDSMKKFGLFLLAVGTLSVCYTIMLHGVPLLKPSGRTDVSAKLFYISELLGTGAVLIMAYFIRKKGKALPWFAPFFLYAAVLLSLMAYRTPVAYFIIITFVVYYYLRNAPVLPVAAMVTVVVLFVGVYGFVRHETLKEGETGAYPSLAKELGTPPWMAPVVPAYQVTREGTGICNKLIENIPSKEEFFQGKLLVADSLTILPGKQITGGALIKKLMTGKSGAGLTPSIIGGLYADFGLKGILAGLFVTGVVLGYLYCRLGKQRTIYNILLYAYGLTFAIQYLHRGIFSPNYVFHMAVLVILNICVMSRKKIRFAQKNCNPADGCL